MSPSTAIPWTPPASTATASSENAGRFQTLCEAGVMQPTSVNTFSPNHGMTRAEFVEMTTDFFGLLGCRPETKAFADVPPESSCYGAVMSARSAGLTGEEEDNRFQPDRYISPDEAQTILNRALVYAGLEERTFTFSKGDYSYIVSPYTIRADIAIAFDTLCREIPLSEAFDGVVLLAGAARDWPVRRLNDVCYVPAEALRQSFPALELPGIPDADEGTKLETEQAFWSDVEIPKDPVPMANTDRVIPARIELRWEDATVNASGFTYRGTPYVSLTEAAELLSLDLELAAN